ncbi:MAG: hypothetical protein H7Z21_19420, partial [Hymenobacter sp.]|nr:hypothetical protein [Hymenobacter sp.]
MAHPCPVDPALAAARAGVLRYHSPYHFLRPLSSAAAGWQEQRFGAGRAAG